MEILIAANHLNQPKPNPILRHQSNLQTQLFLLKISLVHCFVERQSL